MAQDIIDTIMNAITSVFSGWGSSLTTLWRSLVLEYEAGTDTILGTADDVYVGLTDFTEFGLIFLGFGIAMGVIGLLLKKFLF